MPNTYCIRLLPPRPTFIQDMTADERALMGQHAAYTQTFYDKGNVLLYGPVLDPADPFGIAVVQFETEDDLKTFIAGDPTHTSGLGRMVYAPMILAGAQAPRS